MAMSSVDLDGDLGHTISIASLDNHVAPSTQGSIRAVVTLIWPYSASTKSLALLVAEPDFRLRNRRGQVRLQLKGPSAIAVAAARLLSGDVISLSLNGAQWTFENVPQHTPGRSVDGELLYKHKLSATVQRNKQHLTSLRVDDPASPPKIATPEEVEAVDHAPDCSNLAKGPRPSDAWLSPAFFRGSVGLDPAFLAEDYNQPQEDDDFGIDRPSKRTKYGRRSGEWRYVSRNVIPELTTDGNSPEATPSKPSQPSRQRILSLDGSYDDPPEVQEASLAGLGQSHDTSAPVNIESGVTMGLTHDSQSPGTLAAIGSTGAFAEEDAETRARRNDGIHELARLNISVSEPQGMDIQEVPQSPKLAPVQSPGLSLVSPFPTSSTKDLSVATCLTNHPPSAAASQTLDASLDGQTFGSVTSALDDSSFDYSQGQTSSSAFLHARPEVVDPRFTQREFTEQKQSQADTPDESGLPSAAFDTASLQTKSAEVSTISSSLPAIVQLVGSSISTLVSNPPHQTFQDGLGSEISGQAEGTGMQADNNTGGSRADSAEISGHERRPSTPVEVDQANGKDDVGPPETESVTLQTTSTANRASTTSLGTSESQAYTWHLDQDAQQSGLADTSGDSVRNTGSSEKADATIQKFSLVSHENVPRSSIAEGHGQSLSRDATDMELTNLTQRASKDPPTPKDSQEGYEGLKIPPVHDQRSQRGLLLTPQPSDLQVLEAGNANNAIKDPQEAIADSGIIEVGAQKRAEKRRDSVPTSLSKWFTSSRRSSRLHETHHDEDHGVDYPLAKLSKKPATEAASHRRTSHDLLHWPLSDSKLQSPVPATLTRSSVGFTTPLSYYAPLSALETYLVASSPEGSVTVDIFAVVTTTTSKPVKAKTGPKDYSTTLHIADPSFYPQDCQVQCFRPFQKFLPTAEIGDVIILRSFLVRSRKRECFLLSTSDSAWFAWRFARHKAEQTSPDDSQAPAARTRSHDLDTLASTKTIGECNGPPVEAGDEEHEHALWLYQWYSRVKQKEDPTSPDRAYRKRRSAKS